LKSATTIKRMTLKEQLRTEPSKAWAPVEQALAYLALMTPLLLLAEYFGLTDTFKMNLLVGGAIGSVIGSTFNFFSSAALSHWNLPGQADPQALHSAMLALKYVEKQPGVYQPKRPLFSLFHRYPSERITLQTVGDNTLITGPYNRLKKLSAFILTDAQTPAPAPASDHTPPTAPR
jgi:hypothetical protein